MIDDAVPATTAELEAFLDDYDQHSAFFTAHRYQIYRHMLEHRPVVRSPRYGGFWVFSRYEDIRTIARDPENFTSKEGEGVGFSFPLPLLPSESDGEDWRCYRAAINSALSLKAAQAARPRMRALADELLARHRPAGRIDVVLDLAQPISGIVTLEILGLDPSTWREYAEPTHDFVYGRVDWDEALRRMTAMTDRVRADVAEQRRRPTGGLIEFLLGFQYEGRRLTTHEIEGIVFLMHVGGLDTTQGSVGSTAVFLARHPQYRRQMVQNPAIMADAIEELLRVLVSNQANTRTAQVDCEIGGVQIRKGDRIVLLWAAANLDARQFECPFKVDFAREDVGTLSFGLGPHRCAGSHLARAQLQTEIEALLAAAPEYRLIESEVELARDTSGIFGYERVPILY
ncbi:MAG: cytochrome P450 [Gammaproteobacteria bacterium]